MTDLSTAPPPPGTQDGKDSHDSLDGRDWRARLRSSRFGTIGVLVVTALIVTAGAYLVRPDKPEVGPDGMVQAVQLSGPQSGPPPEVGATAPGFTTRSTDGRPVSLESYRGRPIWLTFGATWCSACRVEAPDIQAAFAGDQPKDLAVVSVYLSEDSMTIDQFAQRLGLTYVHVPDQDTAIASGYRVMGIPAHFFIDRDGVLRSTHVGILNDEKIATALGQLG